MGQDIADDLFSSVKYFITGRVKDSVLDCLKNGASKSFYLGPFTTHLLVGEDGKPEDISEAEDMLDLRAVDQDWVLASAYAGARLPLEAFRVERRLFSGLVVHLGADLSQTDRAKLWAMLTWHGGSVVSRLGETVTHLVTSREEGQREGLVSVTPNWVLESIKHNQLQDTTSQDFRQFTGTETEEDGVDKNKNKTPQKLSHSQKTFYYQQQNNLITKYLASITERERRLFYQLDVVDKKMFVFEKGLRIEVKAGNICLTDHQKEILSKPDRPEEKELLSSEKEEEKQGEEEVDEKSEGEKLNSNPSEGESREKKKEEEERDDEGEDERVKQALLNLRPKKETTKLVLTKEQEREMMKMNRQQQHLYFTKLQRQFAANPQQFSASQEEERNALNNIGNLQYGGGGGGGSPRVRTPQRPSSSSRIVRRSIRPEPGPGPLSPYVGQSSDKKISGKLCLLGCTFLITGYQEGSEREHVGKWRVVMERHGASLADSLSQEVTHVLAPRQDSPLVGEAVARGCRAVTAYWLNDIITLKNLRPPWRAVHFPLPAEQQTDTSRMKLAITGFEDQERDYVKDMIGLAGAGYTSGFSRENTAIICKAFEGPKYRVSLDWEIPAVSISWLNEVLFSSEDVSKKLQSSDYRKINDSQENLGIKEDLVSYLLEAWKVPIFVNKDTYYKFKEKEKARLSRGKRSLEQDYDQTILTPDRKRVRLDPRALFDQVS